MKKQLKKFLLGITLQQEYLCVNINEFNEPLKLFTKNNESEKLTDITGHHLFIGYKPCFVWDFDRSYLGQKIKEWMIEGTIVHYIPTCFQEG